MITENLADAKKILNSFDTQTVIEAATEHFNVGGADWDGDSLTVKRNGEWQRLRDATLQDFAEVLRNS
jgi:hypothetical protein